MTVRKKAHSEEFSSVRLGHRLKDMRQRMGITQVELAKLVGVGQTALSHGEDRDDLLLSTLFEYVRALGGSLNVSATFNSGTVPLFGDGLPPSEPVDDSQLFLPGFAPAPRRLPGRDVVLSIKPIYADKILAGTKTVELRRRFSETVGPGALAWIYSTTPTRALTGAVTIAQVQRLPLAKLWRDHREATSLPKVDFDNYFAGLDSGYAIVLLAPRTLRRPVALTELREQYGFEPPQSFQYASQRFSEGIYGEWTKAPNRH